MTDIISLLSNAHVDYRLAPHMRVRRGWVGIDCPNCSPGHQKYRLGFELSSGRCHCWVCGSFYPPEILSKVLNVPQRECYDMVKQLSNRLPDIVDEQKRGKLVIPKGVGDLLPIHRSYLRSRGLDATEMATTWGIQSIGMAARLPWRLFIPVHDRFGRMVSWTTRTVSKKNEKRYHSASPDEEEVSHKSVLYGGHLARHVVIIQEGPIDCWTVGRGAVATLGVGFSKEQMSLMADYPVRVVCFDAEDDAQERAEKLCNELSLIPGQVENVVLETGKDANESDPSEILDLRRKYLPELVRDF